MSDQTKKENQKKKEANETIPYDEGFLGCLGIIIIFLQIGIIGYQFFHLA
ncbi:hypothetical protein SAMN05443252_101370 [Bacillus sp. OV322]|nr:hypothetical protein [Bacillus sp. OV322]SFB99637.1 hypothetical protein SAMN05443252_101370 [Bacillus sp. OV322]